MKNNVLRWSRCMEGFYVRRIPGVSLGRELNSKKKAPWRREWRRWEDLQLLRIFQLGLEITTQHDRVEQPTRTWLRRNLPFCLLGICFIPCSPPPYLLPHAKKAAIWRNMNGPKSMTSYAPPDSFIFAFCNRRKQRIIRIRGSNKVDAATY